MPRRTPGISRLAPDVPDRGWAAPFASMLSIRDLSFAYAPLVPGRDLGWALRGINLEVRQGEFLSIMGPTGAGKTTLCMALNGIVPQFSGGKIKGKVLVDGLDTRSTPVPELARRVGLVFQEPETQIFNMTVELEVAFGLENLGLPVVEIEERITWALAQVGASHLRHRPPFQLSGGEKQRVAIASVLAMTPMVLVLDEPTSNLDPEGKMEVFSAVSQLRDQRDLTIVMVEHESEHIAAFSDRVVVLQEGEIALEGPPQAVFPQLEAMREIGVAVPQVTELAECLNRQYRKDYAFIRLRQARAALEAWLSDGS